MPGTCYLTDLEDAERTTFDEDPVVYEHGPAPRRSSSHETLGGGRVHQDFGAPTADREIRLRTDWMEQTTLSALQTKYAQVGTVWLWSDHLGGEYGVFFRELRPERIRGQAAYRVEMVFAVIEVL